MSKDTGFILYDGPSMLNGKPIIAILTKESSNVKTGNMGQIWILDKDSEPHIAAKTGANDSVCGDCPIKDGCYVVLHQGPLAVYRKYKRGGYQDTSYQLGDRLFILNKLAALKIRFGAYGDPAALPLWLLKAISSNCKDFTGYTHQWDKAKFRYLRDFFLASVETPEQSYRAMKAGFRYFRVKEETSRLSPWEIVCPAGAGTQCKDCLLCNGSKQAKNIVIDAHGARSVNIEFNPTAV